MSCQVLQALASTKRGVSQQPLASPSFKRLTAYSPANSNGSCILLNHKSSSAPMNHSPKCPTPSTNFMAKDLSYHHQQDQRLAFFQKFFSRGGAKSIVMQISVVMLIFLLFLDQILGFKSLREGSNFLERGLPCPSPSPHGRKPES